MESERPPREFVDADLSGARFRRAILAGAVLRSVDVGGVEIDAPWLLDGATTLVVNGVDVAPYVDAELDRRFPGRELRRARTAEELREAWAAVERAWAAAADRVAAMPDGTADRRVDNEWSFSETLRHLVMATDTWLRGAILGVEQPYHPTGMPNHEYAEDGGDPAVFFEHAPTYDTVVRVRAERTAMVRDFLAGLSADDLAAPRRNPWQPQYPETVRSCLHTILEEEWEHLRYALRDLDALASGA